MASMDQHERALKYVTRLQSSKNIEGEAESILYEIDDLVSDESQEPLSEEEKREIIDEIKSIVKKGEKAPDGSWIVEAAENSKLLDVFDRLGRGDNTNVFPIGISIIGIALSIFALYLYLT